MKNPQKQPLKKGQPLTTDPQLVRQTLKTIDYTQKLPKELSTL